MTETFSGAGREIAEPGEMNPEAYYAWLTSLRGPNRSWIAGFRAPAVIDATGLTYRQLDHWARRGLFEPEVNSAAGSGTKRLYSFEDICHGSLMRRLTGERGLTVEAAAQSSDKIRRTGHQICDVAGVFIPTENGPAVSEYPVSEEFEPFIVMSDEDVRRLAGVVNTSVVWLPRAA